MLSVTRIAAFEGGEGEEMSVSVTMPVYRKLAGIKPATPLRSLEVMGLPAPFFLPVDEAVFSRVVFFVVSGADVNAFGAS